MRSDPVSTNPRPKLEVLALLCLLLLESCSGIPGTDGRNDSQVAALLTAQADEWDKAIVQKDRAKIEANMAPDFRQIDGHGNVSTREAFLADLFSPHLTINPYTVEDFSIRRYGDVALLSGTSHLTGRFQGKKFVSHYRYIDIYVRRGGDWKVVSVQISQIPK